MGIHMDWIIANKEWLFSGILVAVPIALIGWLIAKRRSRPSQSQRAGDSLGEHSSREETST